MNDPNHCFTEGCGCGLGPDSLEILYKGDVVGMVCDNCIGSVPGIKLVLTKNDKGSLVLTHVDFMEKRF